MEVELFFIHSNKKKITSFNNWNVNQLQKKTLIHSNQLIIK